MGCYPMFCLFSFFLQSIVSKLVSCITAREELQHNVDGASSDGTVSSKCLHFSLVGLLQRITVEASRTLHDSIKVIASAPVKINHIFTVICFWIQFY